MKRLGWHFSKTDCKLGYGDGREITTGETLIHNGTLKMCESGLHASASILDALTYAPGPYIWRVELSGKIIIRDDKMVATHRKDLWGYDATDVLWRFVRRCALDVVHLWDAPNVVLQYLKTGDESLRAGARDAASSAASSDAWDAASSAASSAAWSAAQLALWAASWAASSSAASSVASSAAWSAAWLAAEEAQSRRLVAMISARRPK